MFRILTAVFLLASGSAAVAQMALSFAGSSTGGSGPGSTSVLLLAAGAPNYVLLVDGATFIALANQ